MVLGALGCGGAQPLPGRADAGTSDAAVAKAAPATITIGPSAHRVGERWIREEKNVHTDSMVFSNNDVRRVVHTRVERVNETVVAVEGEVITERLLVVETKSKVDENLQVHKTTETVDPTSGKRYRLWRVGTTDHATHEDGSSVTVGEQSTLADLVTLVWDRSSLSTVPQRPIAVGEVFAHPASNPKKGITGKLELVAIEGAGDDAVVVFSGTARFESFTRIYARTETWRIRAKDGRTIELTSQGEEGPAHEERPPTQHSKITSTTRVTYL